MRILYSLINFLILAGLLFLVGRKSVVSSFRKRREKIDADLKAAETPLPKPKEYASPSLPENIVSDETIQVRQEHAARIEKLKTDMMHECRELSLDKLKRERKAILSLFLEQVKSKYDVGDLEERENRYNSELLDEILKIIVLTPGDMSYLKRKGVLYVTLTSARPFPAELAKRAKTAAENLAATVNGKISFLLKEEDSLIGGFCFRIGDTVYDGSVIERVEHLTRMIERIPLTEDVTIDTLLSAVQKQIEKPEKLISVYQRGRVISVSDGIAWMDGLSDIMYGEVVRFRCGELGMALDIQRDRIGCIIFGRYEHIESYSRVRHMGRIASVPVGNGLLGRVVNAIGLPIDGKGYMPSEEKRPIEFGSPGILDRASVSRPLHTGIKAIDSMIPIGKGQRELLVGDRQTGKTSIVLDAILNQRGKNVICIYVCIGQKETMIADLRDKLELNGALDYTIIVSGSASDSAAMQYIAPFSATAMGEYFMYAGRDVLIIYDDLSKHAVAYRELSLLLQRPSGREAYPGDIFYLHARLLERSAQLSEKLGGGSMTALPIIETQAGDISSYIPTNVISITDGQIFLESELFHSGQRPAVNVGLSVSRVGGAAQTKLMKQVSSSLRTKLAQYRELADFTQFGADVDEYTRKALNAGEHMNEVLKQDCYAPLEDWKQALLLYAVSEGFSDRLELSSMHEFETKLLAEFQEKHSDLVDILRTGKKMDPDTIEKIRIGIEAVVKEF